VAADLGVDVDALDLDEARLAVAEKQVPAIDRSRVSVTTVTLMKASKTPDLSCRVVETWMPRSRATTGAETMFTSGFVAFITPAITAQFSACRFISATVPS
jgi:hypothetical protein